MTIKQARRATRQGGGWRRGRWLRRELSDPSLDAGAALRSGGQGLQSDGGDCLWGLDRKEKSGEPVVQVRQNTQCTMLQER